MVHPPPPPSFLRETRKIVSSHISSRTFALNLSFHDGARVGGTDSYRCIHLRAGTHRSESKARD
eukprot:7079637-Pyramimonas_sp.AAC.1